MMKLLGMLGGLLLLFVSINGLAELTVRCSANWLLVIIARTPIMNNLQPQPNELYLGYGCPVNIIEEDRFEFLYLVHLCGIRVHVYPLAILIESSITYDPVHLDLIGHIPVSCYIQRKFPISFVMKPRGNSSRECRRPVGQKCSLSNEVEHLEILPRALSSKQIYNCNLESYFVLSIYTPQQQKIFGIYNTNMNRIVNFHEDVFVDCSELWLLVRIRRIPFVDNLLPQSHEFFLGTGCPVSRRLPDYFEFFYALTSCGIRKYEHLWGLLIESSITYEPVVLNVTGITPIFCTVPRKPSLPFPEKWVQNNRDASGETKEITSTQVENLRTLPGMSVGNSFSFELSNFCCLM